MPKGDHWNAAKCIQGEPSALQLEPDHDLGRTTRKDCQNKVRCPADEQRQFGCPTVRTDIPQRKMKSVADHQNYGDEPEVVDVLFPATYTEFNVHENDFQQPKSKDQIMSIFQSIGYTYKMGKFNAIFNRAHDYTEMELQKPIPASECSVRGFIHSMNELHSIE